MGCRVTKRLFKQSQRGQCSCSAGSARARLLFTLLLKSPGWSSVLKRRKKKKQFLRIKHCQQWRWSCGHDMKGLSFPPKQSNELLWSQLFILPWRDVTESHSKKWRSTNVNRPMWVLSPGSPTQPHQCVALLTVWAEGCGGDADWSWGGATSEKQS